MIMNHYWVTYRLDTDKRGDRRYWEGFAEHKEHAIQILSEYVIKKYRGGQTELFTSPQIIILSFHEYLDVFK